MAAVEKTSWSFWVIFSIRAIENLLSLILLDRQIKLGMAIPLCYKYLNNNKEMAQHVYNITI